MPPIKKSKPQKKRDVALLCGPTKDGEGVNIVRQREEQLEFGVVRPLEEGKPINGEIVKLTRRGESPLCDVEVQVPQIGAVKTSSPEDTPVATPTDRGHPAQVASEHYRTGWDAIWKSRKKRVLN